MTEKQFIDPPTVDEMEGVLARIERQRAMWHSDPGYARFLDIEIYALRHLAASRHRIDETVDQ